MDKLSREEVKELVEKISYGMGSGIVASAVLFIYL